MVGNGRLQAEQAEAIVRHRGRFGAHEQRWGRTVARILGAVTLAWRVGQGRFDNT